MHRRRLVLVTPILLAGTACGTESSNPPAAAPFAQGADQVPSDATRVRATVGVEGGSIGVWMPVRFSDARTVVRGDLLLQGRSRRASLAPRDGRDVDRPAPEGPIRVRAGVRVDVAGGWLASCADPAGVPILTVTSRTADGRSARDRYVPADLAAYEKAFAAACRGGLQASLVGSRQAPDGRFSVDLELVNPGPDEVTVTSEAYERDGARWDATSVVVPVGKEAQLRISGRGAGCVPTTPWATGHLTADGKPLKLPVGSDEQC